MGKDFWFPFHVNDFLSSSRVAVMTTEEIGAYILLLCHEWSNPSCTLPNDAESLRKLGRISGDLSRIMDCFYIKGDRIINERLYKEWKIVKQKRKVSHEKAVHANEIRWASSKDSIRTPPVSTVTVTSTSISTIKKEEKKETPLRATVNEVWLTQLKANPAYQHIDLTMQFGKMDAWLAKPGNEKRKKTPTFILNWLNKIEAPITTHGATPCQARITDGRFLRPCGRPSTAGTHTSARCDQHGGTHDR